MAVQCHVLSIKRAMLAILASPFFLWKEVPRRGGGWLC